MRYQIIPDPKSVNGLAIEDTETHEIVQRVAPTPGQNLWLAARHIRDGLNQSNRHDDLTRVEPQQAVRQ